MSIYSAFEEQRLIALERAIESELREVLNSFIGMANDQQVRAQILVTVRAKLDSICRREEIFSVPVYACFLEPRMYRRRMWDTLPPEVHVSIPQYRHDCMECKFLGTHEKDGEVSDLYTCTKQGYRTLIARHGSDGSDYSSVPQKHLSPISKKTSPDLWECDRRSREEGLT